MTTAVRPSAPSESYGERAAAKLRGYLAEHRITNRSLGELLGETQFWVGRRLNGVTPISIDEMARIARALGEPIGRVLPEWTDADSATTAAATLVPAPRTRSSTDRASDYGSEG